MVYYITYAEYKALGGTLDETLFTSLRLDAQGYIDWYTFNRLWKEEWRTEDIMERVQICMVQLINLISVTSNELAPQKQSSGGINVNAQVLDYSNDGVSTKYAVLSAEALYEKTKKEISESIERYLAGVTNNVGRKLLYRGLYPNE